MSIVIALIIVGLVSVLVTKYYPKKQQQPRGFGSKPIPESTHVNSPAPETLTPKESVPEVVVEPLVETKVVVETPTMVAKPRKKPHHKKKPAKKVDA
jgi:hypothetical protein